MEETEKEAATTSVIKHSIEKEMRENGSSKSWRPIAVTKDPHSPSRERTCRDETEMTLVKQAAKKTKTKLKGARVLRGQRSPLKVNNVNRTVVLDSEGKAKLGVLAMVEEENEAKVVKISWLSKKASGKAYNLDR